MSINPSTHQHAQFRTAHFTAEAHQHQRGLPTCAVQLRYSCHQWNDATQQVEPVYACYRTSDRRSSLGTWFAQALERFAQ